MRIPNSVRIVHTINLPFSLPKYEVHPIQFVRIHIYAYHVSLTVQYPYEYSTFNFQDLCN
jgi:ABC-type molybdate transport system ATPase subunit